MSTERESLFAARCADFPDVVVSDAEALEIALREVLDDDEACDAAQLVMRQGWRPRAPRRAAPRFTRDDAYYFGCRRTAGHHFVDAWGNSPPYTETAHRLPFDKIDGGLVPHGNGNGEEGLARLIRRDGWTAIAFCDRSIDTRGNSNAAFFFHAVLSFDEIVEAARETFPWKTFPFAIVLDEETSDPAEVPS